VIAKNGFEAAYLRPVAYRGLGGFGLSRTRRSTWRWRPGKWARTWAPACSRRASMPACPLAALRAEHDSRGREGRRQLPVGTLIAREARRLGFGEGIALASTGLLSEGAGENLFLVFDGALHTTPVSGALLNGITRNTIITLARANGIEVVERDLPREYLYLCDELFMCGTAAEITPIRSVDGRAEVAPGKPGPVTGRIQELFFGLFNGKTADKSRLAGVRRPPSGTNTSASRSVRETGTGPFRRRDGRPAALPLPRGRPRAALPTSATGRGGHRQSPDRHAGFLGRAGAPSTGARTASARRVPAHDGQPAPSCSTRAQRAEFASCT
jgi:branched-chain amino acid aminotransferase